MTKAAGQGAAGPGSSGTKAAGAKASGTKAGRRLRMGLSTVLGLKPQGFFIPYRYADTLPEPPPPYDEVEALLDAARPALEETLALIDGFAADLAALSGPAPKPRWDQEWFPRLDGAAAYALARAGRPRRIVEVGSGHSTRFLAQGVKDGADKDGFANDGGAADSGPPDRGAPDGAAPNAAAPSHVCIDPAPRAALLSLPVDWRREVLSPAHLPLFDALAPGDMAVFDGSHILVEGCDTDLILNRILPRLKPGVLVHIHDVFLPDPYPRAWRWRGYAEQNGLAPWLLSGAYAPVHASHYALTRMHAAARPAIAALPFRDVPESSLWLRRDR